MDTDFSQLKIGDSVVSVLSDYGGSSSTVTTIVYITSKGHIVTEDGNIYDHKVKQHVYSQMQRRMSARG